MQDARGGKRRGLFIYGKIPSELEGKKADVVIMQLWIR
jgi:hypothetical protein